MIAEAHNNIRLPRTYDDPIFSDFAIDHIAVSTSIAGQVQRGQPNLMMVSLWAPHRFNEIGRAMALTP
jgi:hypothetical protein